MKPSHYRFVMQGNTTHDAETGLFYNYFRYYDPKSGRYLRSDPIGLDGGLNTYGYVGGSPLHRVDPFGLVWSPNFEHPGQKNVKFELPPVRRPREVAIYIEKWVCSSETWEEAFSKALTEKMTPDFSIHPMDDDNRTAAEHYIFMRAMISTESGIGTSIAFGAIYPYYSYGYQGAKQWGLYPSASSSSYAQLYWENQGWLDSWFGDYSIQPNKCTCED